MDVASFEHWLCEIAALNLLQRRQAWQALALSEASDSYDGETGEPLGAGIASVSIAEAPGEPSAAMTSSAARPLNRVGTDFVVCGCAGGCDPSTRSGDVRAGAIHSR